MKVVDSKVRVCCASDGESGFPGRPGGCYTQWTSTLSPHGQMMTCVLSPWVGPRHKTWSGFEEWDL